MGVRLGPSAALSEYAIAKIVSFPLNMFSAKYCGRGEQGGGYSAKY